MQHLSVHATGEAHSSRPTAGWGVRGVSLSWQQSQPSRDGAGIRPSVPTRRITSVRRTTCRFDIGPAPNLRGRPSRPAHPGPGNIAAAAVVAHAQGFLRAHQALDGIEDRPGSPRPRARRIPPTPPTGCGSSSRSAAPAVVRRLRALRPGSLSRGPGLYLHRLGRLLRQQEQDARKRRRRHAA